MADASRAHAALLPPDTLEHLVRTYDTEYSRILGYRSWLPDWDAHVVEAAPVIKAQLVHGAREELAQVADDLVQRRTELGARALATDAALRSAADALALKAAPAAV